MPILAGTLCGIRDRILEPKMRARRLLKYRPISQFPKGFRGAKVVGTPWHRWHGAKSLMNHARGFVRLFRSLATPETGVS